MALCMGILYGAVRVREIGETLKGLICGMTNTGHWRGLRNGGLGESYIEGQRVFVLTVSFAPG